jgi:hypothetical protein
MEYLMSSGTLRCVNRKLHFDQLSSTTTILEALQSAHNSVQYVPTKCDITRSGLCRFRAARSSGLRIHMGQLSVTDRESATGTTSVTYTS